MQISKAFKVDKIACKNFVSLIVKFNKLPAFHKRVVRRKRSTKVKNRDTKVLFLGLNSDQKSILIRKCQSNTRKKVLHVTNKTNWEHIDVGYTSMLYTKRQ